MLAVDHPVSRRRATGAGLVFSVLFALALAPVGWWGASFAAVLPLMWIGCGSSARPWRTALWTGLGALAFYLFENAWVYEVTDLGYVPMCLVLACYPTIFVWALLRWTTRFPRVSMVLVAPLLWAGIEVARGEVVFEGYAWGFLGQPMIDSPVFANPGTFLGWYFVSFLTAIPAACVVDARRGLKRWSIGGLLALLAIWGGLWATRPPIMPGEAWSFAVLQTNVPQDNKLDWTLELEVEDWRDFEGLIEQAAAGTPRPEVIVLPETMMPGISIEPGVVEQLRRYGVTLPVRDASGTERRLEMSAFADRLLAIQGDLNIPMLIGEEGLEGFRATPRSDGTLDIERGERFNSVYLVAGGEVKTPRYDKMLLTPFGEFMPYIEYWPWLKRQVLAVGARGMSFDLGRGRERLVLRVPRAGGASPVDVVAPICFEVTRSDHCRRMVFDDDGRRRASVIVNGTNDGWFAWCDYGREQHLQVTRWRSLETATPTIRAANTGISAHIDATGKIVKAGVDQEQRSTGVDGVLTGTVNLGTGSTVYGRVGPIFQWAALAGAGLLVVLGLWPQVAGKVG